MQRVHVVGCLGGAKPLAQGDQDTPMGLGANGGAGRVPHTWAGSSRSFKEEECRQAEVNDGGMG